jgi:hypothetical protein
MRSQFMNEIVERAPVAISLKPVQTTDGLVITAVIVDLTERRLLLTRAPSVVGPRHSHDGLISRPPGPTCFRPKDRLHAADSR